MSSLTNIQLGAWNVWPAYGALGVGNVYHAMQSTVGYYADLAAQFSDKYDNDGTAMIHTTIQAALDATLAERNDYVVVYPDADDYDLTAGLTMSKKCVHLICPGGMGLPYGATNAARIDGAGITTDEVITISAAACEVGGLWLKGCADYSLIELTAAASACNIHHNTIGIKTTSGSATCYGIHGTGESASHVFHRNFITVMYPTAGQTIGGGILVANGTRCMAVENVIIIGGFTNTMTVGISFGTGANSMAYGNLLAEGLNNSGSTFTSGITSNTNGMFLFDNRIAMTTVANSITGGTADKVAVNNYESTNGGVLQDID